MNFLKKKRKEENTQKGSLDYFRKKIEKEQKIRTNLQERKRRFGRYIEQSGFGISSHRLSRIIFDFCILVNLLISAYIIYYFSNNFGYTLAYLAVVMAVVWILVFALTLFAIWMIFYLFIDLSVFKRKIEIEQVLPDFLQLASSNIKAGMTIDRALWYAIRPRFGVLAKEIETVAKETMGGEDLRVALQRFTSKYDSVILKRSINLLIEGLNVGGKIGDLLGKIALNIEELNIRKKEMAASVTTYVIFITFATVIAAPLLFSLSGLLITVINNLSAKMGDLGSSASNFGFAISFSGVSIRYIDFKIFAIVSLIVTSLFSSAIIATIKKGSVKSGFKYVPIFIISSVVIFLIADFLMKKASTLFF